METIKWQDAKFFSGWVEKQSPSIFKGWQKRFLRVLKGKVLVYLERESDFFPKGQMGIDEISSIEPVDSRSFKFSFDDRDFAFRTSNEKERDKWINVLHYLQGKIARHSSIDDDTWATSGKRGHRIQDAGRATLHIMRQSGFNPSNENELSEKCLKAKEIDKIVEIDSSEICNRIQYGFLFKRHKRLDMFQKRWFLLISSRPLSEDVYQSDDMSLDENTTLKKWLVFDTIFYFKFDSFQDSSIYKGHISLVDCHEVSICDRDDVFFISIDLGGRKFELYTEIRGARDKWYEAIKLSRKTAKEIRQSVTKYPRNVCKLENVIVYQGMDKFREHCEDEKKTLIGNYKDIRDYEKLIITLTRVENQVLRTIDGCTLPHPPKIEVLKAYVDVFSTTYLLIVQHFWINFHTYLDTPQIAELASHLFSYDQKLSNLGIHDPNFLKNGKELFNIFLKKSFVTIRSQIETILITERKTKALKSTDGKLITNGPFELFHLFIPTFELIKKYPFKFIVEEVLVLIKECIFQYLIGVDTVTSNYKYDIDKEFLISSANNAVKISTMLKELIEATMCTKVLNNKEIEDALKEKQLINSVNLMLENCIARFVMDLAEILIKENEQPYLTLDIRWIIDITNDAYGQFLIFINESIQKKCWETILKTILLHYHRYLMLAIPKKVKRIEDLTGKLQRDKRMLHEAYEKVLGTNSTLKIIDDFLNFLEVGPDCISVPCTSLKDFIGPAFNFAIAKILINLRTDFSKEEKLDAIASCQEILEIIQKNTSRTSSGVYDTIKSNENENQTIHKYKNYDTEEKCLEEIIEIDKAKRKGNISISDFLLDIKSDDLQDEEENESGMSISEDGLLSKRDDEKIDSDVVLSGYMKKKSYARWQQRFFQVKNGVLYWYKDEKARMAQNFILIETMRKIISHKIGKFLILVDDKVYKFACKDECEKDKWMSVLSSEMKKRKGEMYKKVENLYEMKLKKKVICDFSKLKEISADRGYIKIKVEEALRYESYFTTQEDKKPQSIKPNRLLCEQRSTPIEEKIRFSKIDGQISFSSLRNVSLDFTPNRRTSRSIFLFSCCDKILSCFKRNKSLNENEEHLINA